MLSTAFYFVAIYSYFYSQFILFHRGVRGAIIKIQINLSHLLLRFICLDDYEISRNLNVVESIIHYTQVNDSKLFETHKNDVHIYA